MKNRGGRNGKESAYAVAPKDTKGKRRRNAFYSQEGKERFTVSACTDIGGRPYQEDRMVVNTNCNFKNCERPCGLFAVMDGHGGDACAQFIRSKLFKLVEDNLKNGDYEASLVGALNDAETMWTKTATTAGGPGWSSGSCVCAALLSPDDCVHVCWVGDCRMAAYSTQDGCVPITSDHKPDRASEQSRIENCGGEVRRTYAPGAKCFSCFGPVGAGPPRVYPGGLAVARSIGTLKCKMGQYGAILGCVISTPETVQYRPSNDVRYLIIASDGLWDYFPKTSGLGKVIKSFEENVHQDATDTLPQYILKAIRSRSLGRPPDNVTILVIDFNDTWDST